MKNTLTLLLVLIIALANQSCTAWIMHRANLSQTNPEKYARIMAKAYQNAGWTQTSDGKWQLPDDPEKVNVILHDMGLQPYDWNMTEESAQKLDRLAEEYWNNES